MIVNRILCSKVVILEDILSCLSCYFRSHPLLFVNSKLSSKVVILEDILYCLLIAN